jgi:hypothetical protein
VNLYALDAVPLYERLPNLRRKRRFRQDSDASFDSADSSRGLVEWKIESSPRPGWTRAHVPELGKLLKTREDGFRSLQEQADGSANHRVMGIRAMDGSQKNAAIDKHRHQSWSE